MSEAAIRPVLPPGVPAPWFTAPALSGSANYVFSSAAGRPILMLFFGAAGQEHAAAALSVVAANRDLFDDTNACFFGITCDPADAAQGRITQAIPGIRFFLDYDRSVSTLYGADFADGSGRYRPHWLLLDRSQRVVAPFAIDQGEAAVAALRTLVAESDSLSDHAPVLVVPRVIEPALCRRLIDLYEAHGGEESGFMRQIDGKTVRVTDPEHKRRRDVTIEDATLQRHLMVRVHDRLAPMIARAFQFQATRMERYIVGCYSAGAGHFRPHRDNTTSGTAHRRFAVTINLNTGDYEGGDLRFPEFGQRTYRAPTGGAVVFSCSLLHEATPVTRGTRYAFLPFLYDDAAAKVREENNRFLAEDVPAYRG
jgi:predicted 2-oxoglutarate/Fe(II)-dependent dioxygenase YbiX/peroxiredoxin